MNKRTANHTRAPAAPVLSCSLAPKRCFSHRGRAESLCPVLEHVDHPRGSARRGPCAAVLLSPGCSAGTGSVISFLSSRAGSRDAGVLFLAVTQPPSCPGKCFSPFHVPGYLSVTHALRNGSSALRDSPDKRLRSRLAAGVILAAAQALPRCYPTDPSQERFKARGVCAAEAWELLLPSC